ncbi:MAG TPA: MauE/DoxX family redox-associated membrane protein [Steroidobacteraceae bacterium]|jgi:hypothetical protein|nr:MauE/DoxX family redox-associated membrane protein [Steroidobacteraceae bacterium]
MMAVLSGTAAVSAQDVDRILTAQLAAFIALLLAASAVHKWLRWEHTVEVAREFAGIPRPAASAAALAAGLAECGAAGLMFSSGERMLGALLAAAVLTLYLALIVRALMAGRRNVDCGCSFGAPRHALGTFELARNAVLAIMALWVAVASARGGAPIAASQILGAAALLASYAALDQLMGLQPMRTGAVL